MKKLIFITLLSISFLSVSSAQITAQVGGGLSYNIPQGDAGGSADDFYNGTKYGLSSGYSFFAKARAGIIGTSFFAEIDYSSLNGDGNADNNNGKVEVSLKNFSVKLGPEIMIDIPLSPVTPYFAPYLMFNQLSGEVKLQGLSKVPSGNYNIESAARIGAGGAAGILLKLNPGLKLDLSVHYQFLNLFGKEFKSVNPSTVRRIDSYTTLNDDKDPLYSSSSDEHFISDKRSINNIQFKLGLMIGI